MEQSRWKSLIAWNAIATLLFVVKTWFGFENPVLTISLHLLLPPGVALGISITRRKKHFLKVELEDYNISSISSIHHYAGPHRQISAGPGKDEDGAK